MPIKNYTTKVDAWESLGEIQGALSKHGARKIMIEYAEGGMPDGIMFSMDDGTGQSMAYMLPANVEGVKRTLAAQKVKASDEHARNVAWRILYDWVLAQCAIIESGMVETAEVFMPYITDGQRTMYQLYKAGQLALPQKAGGAP